MIQKSECDKSTGGFCTVGPSHRDGLIPCQRQQAAPTKHIPHCRFSCVFKLKTMPDAQFIFEKHAAAVQLFPSPIFFCFRSDLQKEGRHGRGEEIMDPLLLMTFSWFIANEQ